MWNSGVDFAEIEKSYMSEKNLDVKMSLIFSDIRLPIMI
jgi:hypothetical protein